MSQFIAPGISALTLGVLIAISPAPKFETRAAANEAGVRAADAEWSKAVRAKNADRIASLYVGNATLVPRDYLEVKGRTAIREEWSRIVAIRGFSQNSRMTKIAVHDVVVLPDRSRLGPGAATTEGTYEAAMYDDQNRRVVERGNRSVIWAKQPDGGWKIEFEIYYTNSRPGP